MVVSLQVHKRLELYCWVLDTVQDRIIFYQNHIFTESRSKSDASIAKKRKKTKNEPISLAIVQCSSESGSDAGKTFN